ncbi:hypothetical protein SSYRP_v1c05650 [Spiroplasma syrphidicola EA-1]|uniref:Uncharacterized protein n=1 Tax=Spiroplasma syrphidicola EA-1 TaxID=1276229 RepID=R4UJ59_9MOLU|nr:hypothetical protein [Spiroplasma syrphidicola]AGM26155.1 hypothetical protein SSYRP_v1c05650 [Spiroplasma syrphidicola EA-1]
MKNWFKRKKLNESEITSLKTASSYDDEIEAVSGFHFNDDPVISPIENNEVPKAEFNDNQTNSKGKPENISSILQQARNKINVIKSESNMNEHENLLERLEQLKNLRDNATAQPNEFQQMLNQIKERNFNDRMDYIMSRINASHRDDHKFKNNKITEEQFDEEEVIINANGEKVFVPKTAVEKSKPKPGGKAKKEPKKMDDEMTITLSIDQLQKIVRDTVEDVLVELGIKQK